MLESLTNSTTKTSNCYYTFPDWTPTETTGTYTWTTSYPMYITPEIKVLNVKGKVIFYYWDNQTLNYAIYKEGEKIEFKQTNDFLQVLSELGMFE